MNPTAVVITHKSKYNGLVRDNSKCWKGARILKIWFATGMVIPINFQLWRAHKADLRNFSMI